MELIDSIYVGDDVCCDYCNATITEEDQEGFFIGENAVCLECGKDIQTNQYNECKIEHIAKDFKQAVLKRRNGHHSIDIYST